MDQQLVMGIVLIVVGLAFGLIAAAVVVNRRIDSHERAELAQTGNRSAEAGGQEPQAEAAQAGGPDPEPEPLQQAPGDEPESAAEDTPADEPPDAAGEPAPVAERESEATGDQAPAEAEPDRAVPTAKEAGGETPDDSLLGELHRDPASGQVFLRVGGREYRSAADLPDDQRRRLAGAVSDWSAWFREPARPPAATAIPPSTSGMVQAIDAILQRSLQEADVSTRGVRLVQDITGGVKVLIGVKSYEVEDVPDEEIKRLIRQAVAEWEGQQ